MLKKILLIIFVYFNFTSGQVAVDALDAANLIMPYLNTANFINNTCNNRYAIAMGNVLDGLKATLNNDQMRLALLYMLMVKLINDLQLLISNIEANSFSSSVSTVLRGPQDIVTRQRMAIITAPMPDIKPIKTLLEVSQLIPLTTLDINGQIAAILAYSNFFNADDHKLYASEMEKALLDVSRVLNHDQLQLAKVYMLMVKVINDLQLRIANMENYQFTIPQISLLRLPLARYSECLSTMQPVAQGIHSTAIQ